MKHPVGPLSKCRSFLYSLTILAQILTCLHLGNAGEIKIGGSDLLAQTISNPLQELATRNEHTLILSMDGSSLALKALETDDIDLGIIAIPDGKQQNSEALVKTHFCYLVVVIAVHNSNPLTEISQESLAGIFAYSKKVSLTRWRELGLSNAWEPRKISPHVTSNENTIALELFKNSCLKTTQLKSGVKEWDNPNDLLVHISADSTAIAALPSFPGMGTDTKVLSISQRKGSASYSPTPINVHYGDYSLRLPFYLVYKKENSEKVRDYAKFLLTEQMGELLAKDYLMPLPKNVRDQELLKIQIGNN